MLTSEQELSINLEDKNILVSAAAGSGKTKVLVERVKHLILNKGLDIDKFLIVTFTNAAAQEMRARIQSALNSQMKIESNIETLRRLEKQSALLTSASITTMHSFCQDLLKRNFAKVGIDPKFRVADDNELNIIKHNVIEELFEKKYSSGDENFKKFTDDFGGSLSSDNDVYEVILSLNDFIQSQVDPIKWLKSLSSMFDVDELENTIWFNEALKDIKFMINAVVDECQIACDTACKYNIYVKDIENDMYNSILPLKQIILSGNWDKIYEMINRNEFFSKLSPYRGADKEKADEIKKSREEYRTIINKLKEKYFFMPKKDLVNDLRDLKPSIDTLIDIMIDFEIALESVKREKNIIDFNDMEHFSIKILSDENVVKSLKKKFKVVMVDEYQDTNAVQDKIFSTIATDTNFFAVGDVKQSIYKFRLADPSIFLNKYQTYAQIENCERIDLNKNFRSRKEVLNAVNFVFERLMNDESMEIDYSDSAKLYQGIEYPKELSKLLDNPAEFYLINENDFKNEDNVEVEVDDKTEIKDSIAVQSIEREAQMISLRIKKMIDTKTQVYDSNKGSYRDITYRDIVILRRSNKNPTLLTKVLEKNNIPVYAMGDETYFMKTEVKMIVSLLTILDNMRQDIPLVAVMLSPIGGFSAEELATLRATSNKEDMYTLITMSALSATNGLNPYNLSEEFIKKTSNFLKKISKWREISRMISVPELLTTIYNETGFYDYVGGLENGMARQANLRMLIDKANDYESAGFRGLARFLKFISKIKELNTDLSAARTLGENEDVVRIMTIHKSKGLEFPVVFICELGKNFNIKDSQTDILLKHKELGVGPYHTLKTEPLRVTSFARQVIMARSSMESKAEELRVLYVAMTRAREKLILIGTNKGNEKKYDKYKKYGNSKKVPSFALLTVNNYLDWLMMALSKETDSIKVINVSANNLKIENEQLEELPIMEKDLTQIEIEPKFKSQSIPAKMSVTELKRLIEFDDTMSLNLLEDKYETKTYRRPNFEQTKKISGAEYGTIMHSLMQRLDLNKDLSSKGIREQLNLMTEAKIFTPEQAEVVSVNKAARFFKSSIGKRMLKSTEIYRELPFSRLIDSNEFFLDTNDKIFIQGIIDLLFKDDEDNFILIDYKTDHIDEDEPKQIEDIKEKYKLQMRLYAESIESILHRRVSESYLYMLSEGILINTLDK